MSARLVRPLGLVLVLGAALLLFSPSTALAGTKAVHPATPPRVDTAPPIGSGGVHPLGHLRSYVIQFSTFDAPAGSQVGAEVACPKKTVALGGGVYLSSGHLADNLNTSYPLSDGSGWDGFVNNASGSDATFTVYADCAKAPRSYAIVSSAEADTPAGTHTSVSVDCPTAVRVLGGGGVLASIDTAANLSSSAPWETHGPKTFGWAVSANNAGSGDNTVRAFAVCGNVTGYSIARSSAIDDPAGSDTFAAAACASGTVAIGGGVLASSDDIAVNINSDYPNPRIVGWGAYENNASDSDDSITAYAICGF